MISILALFAVVALTDLQVDQVIRIIEASLHTFAEGVKAVWVALSPIGIGYLMWRQAMNRKALDANTEVSKTAFEVANGHNEKIANLTEQLASVPQKVEVVSTSESPVHTTQP